MKTKSLFLLPLFLIGIHAIGQENKKPKTSLFVGPQVSITAADLAKTQTWGAGLQTQVVHPLGSNNSLTGRVSYTYLFGKNYDNSYYYDGEGGYYGDKGKYKGMHDIGIQGGIRHEFNNNFFGGAEAGLCLGFSDGESEGSYLGQVEFGYLFGNSSPSLEQALALWLGICGDPKIQIGLRYSIRL